MIVSTQNREDWICFAQKNFSFFPSTARLWCHSESLMALLCAVCISSFSILNWHLIVHLTVSWPLSPSPFSLSAFPSPLHLMVVVFLHVAKLRSEAPVFLLHFEELVSSVGAACFTLHGALHEVHSTLTLAGSHKLPKYCWAPSASAIFLINTFWPWSASVISHSVR